MRVVVGLGVFAVALVGWTAAWAMSQLFSREETR